MLDKICLSVDFNSVTNINKLIEKAKLVELRVSEMNSFLIDAIKEFKQNNITIIIKPVVLDIDFIFEIINLSPHYIDIDYSLYSINFNKINSICSKTRVKSICSLHYNEFTPDINQIHKDIIKLKDTKADFVKYVCFANEYIDNIKLYSIYSDFRNLIVFNMGSKGKISRYESILLGAAWAYTYLENPTAEGQIQIDEFIKNLKDLNYE